MYILLRSIRLAGLFTSAALASATPDVDFEIVKGDIVLVLRFGKTDSFVIQVPKQL